MTLPKMCANNLLRLILGKKYSTVETDKSAIGYFILKFNSPLRSNKTGDNC